MPHTTDPSAPGRILITGSRSYDDARRMRDAIDAAEALLVQDRIHAHGNDAGAAIDDIIIIHGDARGADRLAETIAGDPALTPPPWRRRRVEAHPANWRPWPDRPDAVDRRAGFKRNATMVAAGADIALAFPTHTRQQAAAGEGSRGTYHCLDVASESPAISAAFIVWPADDGGTLLLPTGAGAMDTAGRAHIGIATAANPYLKNNPDALNRHLAATVDAWWSLRVEDVHRYLPGDRWLDRPAERAHTT